MCKRSGENGERPLTIRMVKTRAVSKRGKIKIPMATAGLALMASGFVPTRDWLISINFMTKMEEIRPSSKAPVSPIKIFAGVKLYFKKATIDPANEYAIMDKPMLVFAIAGGVVGLLPT